MWKAGLVILLMGTAQPGSAIETGLAVNSGQPDKVLPYLTFQQGASYDYRVAVASTAVRFNATNMAVVIQMSSNTTADVWGVYTNTLSNVTNNTFLVPIHNIQGPIGDGIYQVYTFCTNSNPELHYPLGSGTFYVEETTGYGAVVGSDFHRPFNTDLIYQTGSNQFVRASDLAGGGGGITGPYVISFNGDSGAVSGATVEQGAKADTATQPSYFNGWEYGPHLAWLLPGATNGLLRVETEAFNVFGYTPQAEFTFTTNANNKITLTGFNGTETAIRIPPYINGWPVAHLGDSLFLNKATLTSVTLPETCETIGSYVFQNSGIKSIHIPAAVTNIGAYAFYYLFNVDIWFSGDKPPVAGGDFGLGGSGKAYYLYGYDFGTTLGGVPTALYGPTNNTFGYMPATAVTGLVANATNGLLRSESDPAALSVIATNHTTRLYAEDATQWIDGTGGVWQVSAVTNSAMANWTVTVISDIKNGAGTTILTNGHVEVFSDPLAVPPLSNGQYAIQNLERDGLRWSIYNNSSGDHYLTVYVSNVGLSASQYLSQNINPPTYTNAICTAWPGGASAGQCLVTYTPITYTISQVTSAVPRVAFMGDLPGLTNGIPAQIAEATAASTNGLGKTTLISVMLNAAGSVTGQVWQTGAVVSTNFFSGASIPAFTNGYVRPNYWPVGEGYTPETWTACEVGKVKMLIIPDPVKPTVMYVAATGITNTWSMDWYADGTCVSNYLCNTNIFFVYPAEMRNTLVPAVATWNNTTMGFIMNMAVAAVPPPTVLRTNSCAIVEVVASGTNSAGKGFGVLYQYAPSLKSVYCYNQTLGAGSGTSGSGFGDCAALEYALLDNCGFAGAYQFMRCYALEIVDVLNSGYGTMSQGPFNSCTRLRSFSGNYRTGAATSGVFWGAYPYFIDLPHMTNLVNNFAAGTYRLEKLTPMPGLRTCGTQAFKSGNLDFIAITNFVLSLTNDVSAAPQTIDFSLNRGSAEFGTWLTGGGSALVMPGWSFVY